MSNDDSTRQVPPRVRVLTPVGTETRTKQADKDLTNVNRIMAKYRATGILQHMNPRTPDYGDFSNVGDYFTALNKVNAAQDAFADLPAKVRDHVDHDAGKFLELIFDESRRGELEELGLIEPSSVPAVEAEPPEGEADPVAGGD